MSALEEGLVVPRGYTEYVQDVSEKIVAYAREDVDSEDVYSFILGHINKLVSKHIEYYGLDLDGKLQRAEAARVCADASLRDARVLNKEAHDKVQAMNERLDALAREKADATVIEYLQDFLYRG